MHQNFPYILIWVCSVDWTVYCVFIKLPSFDNGHFLCLQGENPIYKQATSTFKNPTYAGKWLDKWW